MSNLHVFFFFLGGGRWVRLSADGGGARSSPHPALAGRVSWDTNFTREDEGTCQLNTPLPPPPTHQKNTRDAVRGWSVYTDEIQEEIRFCGNIAEIGIFGVSDISPYITGFWQNERW